MARDRLKVKRIKKIIEKIGILDSIYEVMPISMLVKRLQNTVNIVEMEEDWTDYIITIKKRCKKQALINEILSIFNDKDISKYFSILSLE